MAGKGEARTSPRRLSSAQRRLRAFELKKAGLSYEKIAATPTSTEDPTPLYPGPNGRKRAQEAVAAHMRELAKETDGVARELRALELARLDELQVSLWPSTRPVRAVYCPEAGCHGVMYREVDHDSVRSVLQVMQRRAKYVGLDASDVNDGRVVALMEQQVALARQAVAYGMEQAGLAPEVQREVLEHAATFLRHAEQDDQ